MDEKEKNTMDDEIEKKYYSIGEVAELLQVNTSLIRFWESQFSDFIKPKKNKKGVRQFVKEDIKKLKLIYHLVKEKGYTIQGAKDFLKEKSPSYDVSVMIQKLQETKQLLLKLQGLLNDINPT
ncbi:MAG: MerR family transcriptional regulator [Flammeovirgaceae bacterium]|nr:MerR family transcriptional regulator [Flammeovirgaceae bacterium]